VFGFALEAYVGMKMGKINPVYQANPFTVRVMAAYAVEAVLTGRVIHAVPKRKGVVFVEL
jgi:hypothetical protein